MSDSFSLDLYVLQTREKKRKMLVCSDYLDASGPSYDIYFTSTKLFPSAHAPSFLTSIYCSFFLCIPSLVSQFCSLTDLADRPYTNVDNLILSEFVQRCWVKNLKLIRQHSTMQVGIFCCTFSILLLPTCHSICRDCCPLLDLLWKTISILPSFGH
jgi:hypothetical protein